MYFVADTHRLQWVRVRCTVPFCGHSRAMPLAPWRIRWGVQNPTQIMRQYFTCGSCGRKGCTFTAPYIGTGQNGRVLGDNEPYPYGDELRINGERKWPETYPDAAVRVVAEYK